MQVNWNNQSTGEDVVDTWSIFLQERKEKNYFTAPVPRDAT